MTRIGARGGPAAVVAAAFIVGGASGASAATVTAIDVPAQAFGHDPSRAKPIIKWQPYASREDRDRSSGGERFLVSVPVGAQARVPMTLRLHWARQVSDATTAAEDEDDDFIREATGR